jgi:hypothetical protein
LSKLEGVGRVHPFGHNGKALVFVTDAKAFSADKVKEALAGTQKLRLRHIEKASIAI